MNIKPVRGADQILPQEQAQETGKAKKSETPRGISETADTLEQPDTSLNPFSKDGPQGRPFTDAEFAAGKTKGKAFTDEEFRASKGVAEEAPAESENITDGTSNTILLPESEPQQLPGDGSVREAPGIPDETPNTLLLPEETEE